MKSRLLVATADITVFGLCALMLSLAVRWEYPLPVLALLLLSCIFFTGSAVRELTRSHKSPHADTNQGPLARFQELMMWLIVGPIGITEIVYKDEPYLGGLYGSMAIIAACLCTAEFTKRRRNEKKR